MGVKKRFTNMGSIFERFAVQLEGYTRTGQVPREGDLDLQFGLELQKQRLEKRNMSLVYDFEPRGLLLGIDEPLKTWKDWRYVSQMVVRSCTMYRKYRKEGKNVYKDKERVIFYQTITNVFNQDKVADDVHDCPDCGAIIKIGELQKGCSYCGAKFKISDLFPKVTTYYFVKDAGYAKGEMKQSMAKYMITCGILFLIGLFIYHSSYNPMQPESMMELMIACVIGGAIGGVVMGYFAWAIIHLMMAIVESIKSLPMLPTLGSGNGFIKAMKQVSPEFSYEYFSNKVVSLLKSVMYAENPEELPTYIGVPLENRFADVIDVMNLGAVGFENFRIQNGYCYVSVCVFMKVLRDKKGKLKEKREKHTLQLMKNIMNPVDFGFSIRHLECKSCGASFDATRQKGCPNCGTIYPVAESDWVITEIK